MLSKKAVLLQKRWNGDTGPTCYTVLKRLAHGESLEPALLSNDGWSGGLAWSHNTRD
jgi:hypothetical protein